MKTVLIIAWLICGVIARCLAFAFAQGESGFAETAEAQYWWDWWVTWLLVLFGPVGLLVTIGANAIFASNPFKHGLRLK